MTKEKLNEIIETYNSLMELGVVFYYSSENISTAEITSIEFLDNESLKIELDYEKIEEIHIDDLIENHFKEGNNYHTWHLSRKFDSLLT